MRLLGTGTYHINAEYKETVERHLPLIDFGDIMNTDALIYNIRNGFTIPAFKREVEVDIPVVNTDTVLDHGYSALQVTSRPSSQHIMAVMAVREQIIAYIPAFDTYVICGTGRIVHTVNLRPKERCTCSSSRKCYHIMAALIREFSYIKKELPKLNLNSLEKNARIKKGQN